jgi:signal transduction histidine kinase
LISDLLDLTRARLAGGIPVVPRPANFEEICRSVVGEVRTAQPDCPISLEVEGDVSASVDRERMAQVVANLVSNATRFGCDSGIAVTLHGSGDGVELEVHNYGEPIAPELLPVIFDPFRRAALQRESVPGSGLGLGLFIAREIVEAHRGSIDVSSSLEEGTSFRVWIPRDPARAPGPRRTEVAGGPLFRMRSDDKSNTLGALLLH